MDKDSKNINGTDSVKVSVFKNAMNPNPINEAETLEILQSIKAGKFRGIIEDLNNFVYGSKDQEDFKKSKIPAIAWSGLFDYRASNRVKKHSGLICMDFDKIPDEELQPYFDKLKNDPYTYSVFRSPRRNGYKCLVRIPAEIQDHETYFDSLFKHYGSKYLDKSGRDISRLCFVSYDPDLFINLESSVWQFKNSEPMGNKPGGTGRQVQQTPAKEPRTQSKDNNESIIILNRLIKWELTRGNLYVDGNKHKFLVSLFSACNRYGIKKEESIRLIYDKFKDSPGTEIVSLEDFRKRADSVYYLYQDKHNSAIFTPEEDYYIRVGINYFKVIKKPDHDCIPRPEIKAWNKETIILDHGKEYLKSIPKYDDFIIIPDNLNYTSSHGKYFNLYHEFSHQPQPGEWIWSGRLLQHIFGDQYELGIRLLQLYYLYPKRIAPILVLVSKVRQTGKTTFINWLNMIFGGNVANVSPDDLVNGFNAFYATSNLICIEETLIEKQITVEKLKALSTQKKVTVNQKHVSHYEVDFFGKIILTSNNEDKFARIDEEEIRFFVRKLGNPKFINHNIEQDLKEEIPSFLHYLTTLPPIDFSKDRTGFTPDELNNEFLKAVKDESKSWLCKELLMHFEEMFLNEMRDQKVMYADPKSIKAKFYEKDSRIDLPFIRKVLKEELHLENTGSAYLKPLDSEQYKQARFYIVNRDQIIKSTPEDNARNTDQGNIQTESNNQTIPF